MAFRIALFALVGASACQPVATQPVPPADPGGKTDSIADPSKAQLIGSVINEATGAPIPNVRVWVLGHAEPAFTNREGVFAMADVEPGARTIVGVAGEPHCNLITNALNAELVAGANTVPLILAAPPETLRRKVLVINYDPVLEVEGGVRLNAFRQWNDPRLLMDDTLETIAMCSGNYLHYEVAEWIDVDAIPVLEDGYVYSDQEYLDVLNGVVPAHDPSMADPQEILLDFDLLARVDSGEFDEVVMWGGPYMGFFESRMIGPSPHWVNGPQINTQSERNFVLMGLNPERGVAEALHSYGHRIESHLTHALAGSGKWQQFAAYDQTQPGNAGCGTIHHPPNAVQDYDYGNEAEVPSRCRQYFHWPNLDPAEVDIVNHQTWGGDDFHRRYLEWWLVHIPKFTGSDVDGHQNNWWKYIADFDS